MPKVSVPQLGKVLDCEVGKNLMDLLLENEIPVASSCLGEGICSKCHVLVFIKNVHQKAELPASGSSHQDPATKSTDSSKLDLPNSTPPTDHSELEKRTLERNKLTLDHRLSCQFFIQEDIEVKTTYW